MKDSTKKRYSSNVDIRAKEATQQPRVSVEAIPGYGDKKLDGPNRPST